MIDLDLVIKLVTIQTQQANPLITHLEKALALSKTKASIHKQFAGDNSKSEPPDPLPNSEVKPLSADGSVGLPM